ncbi:hypothetical protein AYI69_g182 [Smittium culicis]|uniref:FHA domain-containing protein n=1 Tax=Smittium culicis TaxID=133412 RepID=A0A1R1YTQ7_9FUNG|nr:hypothetical protein AYI69_g182 [Smittium culicis]
MSSRKKLHLINRNRHLEKSPRKIPPDPPYYASTANIDFFNGQGSSRVSSVPKVLQAAGYLDTSFNDDFVSKNRKLKISDKNSSNLNIIKFEPNSPRNLNSRFRSKHKHRFLTPKKSPLSRAPINDFISPISPTQIKNELTQTQNSTFILKNSFIHSQNVNKWNLYIRNYYSSTSVARLILENGTYSLGRSPQADIRLDSQRVSGKHALLEIGKNLYLHILKSKNGVSIGDFKNKIKQESTIKINNHSRIWLADIEIYVEIHNGTNNIQNQPYWVFHHNESNNTPFLVQPSPKKPSSPYILIEKNQYSNNLVAFPISPTKTPLSKAKPLFNDLPSSPVQSSSFKIHSYNYQNSLENNSYSPAPTSHKISPQFKPDSYEPSVELNANPPITNTEFSSPGKSPPLKISTGLNISNTIEDFFNNLSISQESCLSVLSDENVFSNNPTNSQMSKNEITAAQGAQSPIIDKKISRLNKETLKSPSPSLKSSQKILIENSNYNFHNSSFYLHNNKTPTKSSPNYNPTVLLTPQSIPKIESNPNAFPQVDPIPIYNKQVIVFPEWRAELHSISQTLNTQSTVYSDCDLSQDIYGSGLLTEINPSIFSHIHDSTPEFAQLSDINPITEQLSTPSQYLSCFPSNHLANISPFPQSPPSPSLHLSISSPYSSSSTDNAFFLDQVNSNLYLTSSPSSNCSFFEDESIEASTAKLQNPNSQPDPNKNNEGIESESLDFFSFIPRLDPIFSAKSFSHFERNHSFSLAKTRSFTQNPPKRRYYSMPKSKPTILNIDTKDHNNTSFSKPIFTEKIHRIKKSSSFSFIRNRSEYSIHRNISLPTLKRDINHKQVLASFKKLSIQNLPVHTLSELGDKHHEHIDLINKSDFSNALIVNNDKCENTENCPNTNKPSLSLEKLKLLLNNIDNKSLTSLLSQSKSLPSIDAFYFDIPGSSFYIDADKESNLKKISKNSSMSALPEIKTVILAPHKKCFKPVIKRIKIKFSSTFNNDISSFSTSSRNANCVVNYNHLNKSRSANFENSSEKYQEVLRSSYSLQPIKNLNEFDSSFLRDSSASCSAKSFDFNTKKLKSARINYSNPLKLENSTGPMRSRSENIDSCSRLDTSNKSSTRSACFISEAPLKHENITEPFSYSQYNSDSHEYSSDEVPTQIETPFDEEYRGLTGKNLIAIKNDVYVDVKKYNSKNRYIVDYVDNKLINSGMQFNLRKLSRIPLPFEPEVRKALNPISHNIEFVANLSFINKIGECLKNHGSQKNLVGDKNLKISNNFHNITSDSDYKSSSPKRTSESSFQFENKAKSKKIKLKKKSFTVTDSEEEKSDDLTKFKTVLNMKSDFSQHDTAINDIHDVGDDSSINLGLRISEKVKKDSCKGQNESFQKPLQRSNTQSSQRKVDSQKSKKNKIIKHLGVRKSVRNSNHISHSSINDVCSDTVKNKPLSIPGTGLKCLDIASSLKRLPTMSNAISNSLLRGASSSVNTLTNVTSQSYGVNKIPIQHSKDTGNKGTVTENINESCSGKDKIADNKNLATFSNNANEKVGVRCGNQATATKRKAYLGVSLRRRSNNINAAFTKFITK